MGIKALWERIPTAGLDPLLPDNPLMFWPGPLSGLPLAGASRVAVVTKSALTCSGGKPCCQCLYGILFLDWRTFRPLFETSRL